MIKSLLQKIEDELPICSCVNYSRGHYWRWFWLGRNWSTSGEVLKNSNAKVCLNRDSVGTELRLNWDSKYLVDASFLFILFLSSQFKAHRNSPLPFVVFADPLVIPLSQRKWIACWRWRTLMTMMNRNKSSLRCGWLYFIILRGSLIWSEFVIRSGSLNSVISCLIDIWRFFFVICIRPSLKKKGISLSSNLVRKI